MTEPIKIGILTSGGDAPGMNAAVRAVVRGALAMGAEPYAIYEGWQGAVDGGDRVKKMEWGDVGSILDKGGTIIGTARSQDFRERWGMRTAAKNLMSHGIDRIVVIGGDGSLAGTNEFRREWPSMLTELVESGEVTQEAADAHPELFVVGLVGSIDNDMVGTDTTIGADTALVRIVDAIDQISSTAASHQRTFILEVMGRRCGYLALLSAVAGGCDYVLIPESPPEDGWEDVMVEKIRLGRAAGRRESIIILAEGAADRSGERIDSRRVSDVLKQKADIDARVTILGHVQRGGTPTAYDRWMPSVLGFAAAQELLNATPGSEAHVLGVRHNRVARFPLMEAVEATRGVGTAVAEGRYEDAVAARGHGYGEMIELNNVLTRPPVKDVTPDDLGAGKRVAIIHAGGLAPGMNSAARAAVRLGKSHGYQMLGVQGGFPGLVAGDVRELSWSEVDEWAGSEGAYLGTRRTVPSIDQLYALGRSIENNRIDGLLVIGGYNAYLSALQMVNERARYQAFNIPIVCVPSSIDNNLPGSEISIGADTAVNSGVWALDRVKASAAASRRCFVTEVMGRHCGYLALMSGMSAGAEYVYLHEDGLTLSKIAKDADRMRDAFESGRDLFLVVTNEETSEQYNTEFLARAFEEEGGGVFDVRQQVIGHLQQGDKPSPFDRVLSVRLVNHALNVLDDQFERGKKRAYYVGLQTDGIQSEPLDHMMEEVDEAYRRPLEQWWLDYRGVGETISLKGSPVTDGVHILDVEV